MQKPHPRVGFYTRGPSFALGFWNYPGPLETVHVALAGAPPRGRPDRADRNAPLLEIRGCCDGFVEGPTRLKNLKGHDHFPMDVSELERCDKGEVLF